jgi:isopentenyl diphosphate isomerase/L-lactate dehydrogenase-like FMN-dependent dehydrogenase
MLKKTDYARRSLLQFMLQSPLLAASPAVFARPELAIPETARQALDVFQIKAVASQRLSLPAWHFIVNGADAGKTMAANRAVFDEWELRVRRMVDVSSVDTSLELFGQKLSSPIILAPVGAQRLIHPDGEIATAEAAKKKRHLMICSMMTNYSYTDIAAVGGQTWFQLYGAPHESQNRHMLEMAEEAGSPVVVLTVDTATRGNREGERWFRKDSNINDFPLGNFDGYTGKRGVGDPAMTWGFIDWLRANTRMKIVLKGIVTEEDAALAVSYGVDGIIVSNHGGRQEESNRGTLDSLIEVLEGTQGDIPVLMDSGVRRGTDTYKALALGARAVCIGRPYLWGLGAFGQEGVERVLKIEQDELLTTLRFAGAPTLADIRRDSLVRAS